MSIYSYVYKCVHKITGELYIGYRCKNVKLGLAAEIDFPQYRTSSKYVKSRFDEFDWFIIAEFFSAEHAYDFEQELIQENWTNPLLLNKRLTKSKSGSPKFRNTKCSKETANKIGLANKGKVAWNKGLTKTDPRVAKYAINLSKPRGSTGYKNTEDHLRKRMDSRSETLKLRCSCPFCRKESSWAGIFQHSRFCKSRNGSI